MAEKAMGDCHDLLQFKPAWSAWPGQMLGHSQCAQDAIGLSRASHTPAYRRRLFLFLLTVSVQMAWLNVQHGLKGQ